MVNKDLSKDMIFKQGYGVYSAIRVFQAERTTITKILRRDLLSLKNNKEISVAS